MGNYLISILTAFSVFPFIAFILTIPFLIHQYHKYGAIPIFKSIIFYSLILYLVCAYFMIILPLPSFKVVNDLKGNFVQLYPFKFIKDITLSTTLKIDSPQMLLKFLNTF